MAEFRDVYRFDLSGNYKSELDRVRRGLDGVRGDWDKLKKTFAAGARFRTPLAQLAAETKGLSKEQKAARIEAERQYQAEVKLLDVNNAVARAYNQVTSELNRLSVQRQADLIILGQTKKARSSIIIEARAEATALRRLTKQLEEKATAEKFAALAAAENLQVSADGTRIFNAEAEALKKIARYQERVAVARELAARGFDPSGNPAAPPTIPQTPEQKVKQRAQDQFDRGLQAKQIKLETLELQKNSAAYQDVTKKLKDAQKEVKAMAKAGEETQSAFNRVSFTFRRLIGIMAAFTIARQVVSGFNAMVASAINFNSEMERARVGISGLVAAAADVRAPDGEQLGLGDQLLRAQDLAIDQMKQLRRDALETAASYEELAFAFQTAVAPGLQNNLTLDQIREITVDISQAATGLGVAQNQLAEEIRSLFEGTITPRNTRVATALGISNADIRRAQELGDLFGFLQSRFAAISATGVKLMDTFSAQMSNAADSFKQLLESASKPLFLQLKAGLEDVNRAIASITDDEVIFNEPAVRAFGELFKGLASGVRGIRLAFSEINLQGFADSLGLVGRVLGTTATVLANGFRIAFNAVSPAISAVNVLLAAINAFITKTASQIPDFLKTILSNTTKTVVLILLAQKSLSVINSTYVKIVSFADELRKIMQATNAQAALANANFKGLKGLIASLTLLMRKLLLPLLLIVGAISAIDIILQEMGVNFSIFDSIAEGFSYLSSQLDRMIGGAEDGKEALENLNDPDSVALLVSKYAELRGEIAQLGETMSRDVVRSARDLTTVLNSLNSPQQLQQQLRAQTQATDSLEEQIRKIETSLSGSRSARSSLADPIAAASEQVQVLNDKLKNLATRFAETNGGAEGLASRIKEEFNISDDVLQRYREEAGLDNRQTGNPRIDQIRFDVQRLRLLEREGLTLENLRKTQDDIRNSTEYQNKLAGQSRALLENENSLLDQKNQLIAEANRLANIQVRELNANILRQQQQDLLAAQVTLTESRAAVLAATASGAPAADALRAEAALNAALNKQLQDRLELQEAIANSKKLLQQAQATEADNEVIVGLGQQIVGYGKLLRVNEQINAERIKAAAIEKQLSDLRATNTVGAGVDLGLEEFRAANTFNVAGQNFAKAAAGGLASFVGGGFRQIVAAAFDPNQNVDLATLARGIGVEIAAGLIEDSVRALTAQLIPELAGSLAPDAARKAAEAAEQAAALAKQGAAVTSMTGQVTLSFSAAAQGMSTVIGAAAKGMVFAVQVATQAALATITAAQAAQSGEQSGAVLGALAGAAAGAGGGATGGKVRSSGIGSNRGRGPLSAAHAHARGFATGGRPVGLDPRDTIPAWLRPGEFVIRPEAVSRYGDWLFDLLNKGAVNPNALRGLKASAPRTRSTKTNKVGFATGGAVTRPSGGGSGATTSLQFFDEQVMDRAYASGGGSMDRFVRRRRSNFRAALGLEPGT